MKKYLFIFILLLTLPAMCFAQEEDSPYFQTKNEIGVSYGVAPSGMYDARRDVYRTYKLHFWDVTPDELKSIGPISIDYAHFLTPNTAIGVSAGYSQYSHEIHLGGIWGWITRDDDLIHRDERSYIFVIPTVKQYWKRREHWSWYCLLGVGGHYLHEKKRVIQEGQITEDYNARKLYCGIQITPIGLEYAPNPNLVFTLQYGYGDLGSANFGIKMRW